MKKLAKICLKSNASILNDLEMKSILGGSDAAGKLTGVRCYNNQCYCDFHIYDGDYVKCDVPCGSSFCSSMGVVSC